MLNEIVNVGLALVIAGLYIYDSSVTNKKMEKTLAQLAVSNESISRTLAIMADEQQQDKARSEMIINKLDKLDQYTPRANYSAGSLK